MKKISMILGILFLTAALLCGCNQGQLETGDEAQEANTPADCPPRMI